MERLKLARQQPEAAGQPKCRYIEQIIGAETAQLVIVTTKFAFSLEEDFHLSAPTLFQERKILIEKALSLPQILSEVLTIELDLKLVSDAFTLIKEIQKQVLEKQKSEMDYRSSEMQKVKEYVVLSQEREPEQSQPEDAQTQAPLEQNQVICGNLRDPINFLRNLSIALSKVHLLFHQKVNANSQNSENTLLLRLLEDELNKIPRSKMLSDFYIRAALLLEGLGIYDHQSADNRRLFRICNFFNKHPTANTASQKGLQYALSFKEVSTDRKFHHQYRRTQQHLVLQSQNY